MQIAVRKPMQSICNSWIIVIVVALCLQISKMNQIVLQAEAHVASARNG